MLEWRIGGVRCRLSLLLPAWITALLLWQPDGLAVSCLLASLIHEGGHLLAMMALKVAPTECTLGAFGVRMDTRNTLAGYGRTFLVALAGPLANGVTAIILYWMNSPFAAVVHVALAAVNLLPVAALDGGELLRCGMCLMGLERLADAFLRLASVLVLVPIAVVSLWLLLDRHNPSLTIICAYLVALMLFSKKNEKST